MKEVNITPGFDLNSVTPPPADAEAAAPKTKFEIEREALRKVIESVRIDRSIPIEKPETCLSVIRDGKEAILGTLGNFSLIIGKAKSKKTFSLIMFFHAIVANQTTRNNFKGQLPPGKTKAIFFDTEQGAYHVYRFDKRVCSLLGIPNPANFESFHLRKFPPNERLAIIDQVIADTPDLGFVAIDGARDLVNSINDEEEATKLASYLLRWTEERGIHIVTVLHQNKGDNNARGHLGTELVNKAETVLSVTKDPENKDLSIVEAEYCRDISPEPFAFTINDQGLPEVVDDWSPAKGNNNKVTAPEDVEEFIHIGTLKNIFEKEPEQRGRDLSDRIKTAYDFGDTKARTFRTYFKDQGWIKWNSATGKTNDPNGFWTLNIEEDDDDETQAELIF